MHGSKHICINPLLNKSANSSLHQPAQSQLSQVGAINRLELGTGIVSAELNENLTCLPGIFQALCLLSLQQLKEYIYLDFLVVSN